MELGESLEDTAKREVFEETGLRIANLQFLGIFFLVKIIMLNCLTGMNFTPLQPSIIQEM